MTAIPSGVAVVLAIGLRLAGLLIPFLTPTSAMSPTIRKGDCVVMEGISYKLQPPTRGDLLIFRTGDIPSIREDTLYVKRLVGLPGERLRIREGELLVNDRPMRLLDAEKKPIRYLNAALLSQPAQEITVPPDSYFVLGDNSANSADGRYWGFVPKRAVLGRVWFRCWPWR
jgi:signal peptidase I